MRRKKNTKGFTLIETLLVVGVIMIMSMIKMRDISDETETIRAKVLSGQIKTVSQATNAFLVLKYDELSKLSVPGVSCSTSDQTCNLTLKNLSDNALLPPNFSAKTILGNPYEIQLKRTGSAPNYMFSGIVLTKGTQGTTTEPIFLGKTLQFMGQDGGVNKTTNKISGNAGSWSADNTIFPILTNKKNYVGAAVGSLSGAYYVYLRRDGALPMTGDLNLDSHNINNVKNLTATGDLRTTGNISGNVVTGSAVNSTGTISAAGTISANGHISSESSIYAKNGYGDQLMLGGDAGGNDYEIRLSSAKPLSIFSPNATDYTTVLQIGRGNVKFNQRLGLAGVDPNAIPSGWGGGLATLDAYATGTVAAGTGGAINSYLNSAGDVYAKRNLDAGYIYSRGNIKAANTLEGNYVNSLGNVYAAGNLDANYIHSRGSMYITGNIDTGYIRSRGNIDAAASIYAQYIKSHGNLDASGRINTNEFVYIGGVANAGRGCSPNGLQGRDGSGALLSCINGVWNKAGGGSMRVCASYCGGQWPNEVGRLVHDGDWSAWKTLGAGCTGSYVKNWSEPVMCTSN